ncbi:uncharacterized protein LOC142329480 [Lycorma delicatula]|uniref:uncharacterized protein LOC142329480 n=1 Tax=Lycorma delicatula TaxID=130591 RepID=UPI003F50D6F7
MVPSLVNEDDSIDEQSKMDDINETIDMNLNTVSSSATPAPADRSSSVSNLRFSFTNQRSVAKYSILIFDQLIKEQKLRSEQQKAAFKLREKALRDRVKAEFTLLEVQRRTLREKGLDDQAKNIKKKQRGLLLKWKQNQDEIVRQRSAEELTSKERIMMLLQQQNLVKMQMSTKNTLRKIKSAVATFASREQSRKKTSASGLLSGGNRCASLSSFDESSDNESRRVVHQNQEHHKRKSLNVSDVSGNSGVSSSSASDTGKLKKNRSTSAVLYKETTEDYSSDQNNSINWKELQQKKSHTRIVLDRSTSPFQLTPVESNLNKQTIVNSIVPSQTGSSDHVASIVDNTSRIISSIHGSSDLQSNNISEDLSKSSQLNARNTNTSRSRSGSVSQIQEELEGEMLSNSNILKIPVLPTKYNSDDLESPISSATGGSHSNRTKNESVSTAPSSPHQIRSSVIPSRQHSVSIKDPLTPQLPVGQCRTRRRCSSGSDDSVILSQNETFSEQSDLEVRLSALHEQLRQRKLEAEKLRKEQKRAQRERLKAKEQSLLKQIQAYDVYIEQVRKDLEQDMDASTIPIMKPLIKQTRVTLRKPDNVMNKTSFKQEKKSVASDESVSEASSLETTIQSPQQIQHSVEVQSDIDVVTKSTDSVSEVIETSNKPDIIEEVESSSGKWIDAADFFGDKTSDVEECLEENKNSVTESISDEQIYSEEINDLESKGISSDSKVESELPGIEENTTGEKSIESVNEVEENNLSIIESFKVNDEGFKSMEEPEESPRSIKELEESPSSDISQKNIQIEHTESAELQEVSTANEHLSSSNFIITVQSEHQDVENTLQKSVKDNDHLDSDNSIKSIRSDYQNTDDSAKTIEEKSDRSEVNISENSHDRNSSSITNDVPIIHSENSVIDTFESDIESSENYSDHDVDNIEKVCSNKSKICNELDFSLENKFPLPLVNIESESNDKSIDDKLSTDNESDIDQISPIHSDKVPINLLLDKSNDVNLSDTILSPSIPEEHSSESIKSGLDLGFSDVKKAENNDDDEEIELEETYLGEEEEAKLGDIEDKKFKKELNDEESLKIISESIDLKESSDDSGSLKLEDSFESKSSTGTELDNINNFNEKLNFDSDKSFSIHEDDLSNEIEDVIKVFVTEKEKVVEVKEVMYSTDDGDNDDVLIQENLIKEELHNDSDDDLFSYKTNKNNLCNIKDKRIDRITDKIFSDILKDSLSFSQKIFSDKLSNKYLNKDLDFETPFITALKKDKEREEKNNIENIMDSVLHKSVKEATDSIIKIYQKKTSFLMSSSQLLDNDKFKKLQEINSINTANQKIDSLVQQTVIPGELSPSKEQAFIVLSSTPSGNENNIKDAENSSDKKVDVKSIWLDEDMGLGRTCKEAEELRLQQLQIEQEIQQLERASAGQIGYDEHIPSYYYVREIPNKPPPPYTPPGQACIPTNHQDILAIVYTTTDYLYSAHSQGNDLSKLQPPNKLLALDDSPRSIYKRFLFDLTRQLILEAIDSGQDENLLPWEKTEYKRKCWIPQKTGEIIKHIVTDRVKVLFGFETRSVKENLIIRWSRKKRDKVDELLVRESQEEEQEWTDFSLDENAIKNKISLSILDSLLLETGTVLQAAFHNKMNRIRSCLLDT